MGRGWTASLTASFAALRTAGRTSANQASSSASSSASRASSHFGKMGIWTNSASSGGRSAFSSGWVSFWSPVSAVTRVNGHTTGEPNHTGLPVRTRSPTSTDSPGSSFGSAGLKANANSSPAWPGVKPTCTGALPSLRTASR
ncbi:hypothetical protein SHIRM173S_07504 [Streptomyces hirsutus]